MATGSSPPSEPAPVERRAPRPGSDVRASRVYVFSRRPLLGGIRRLLSVLVLVAVDVLGLALGLYLALVLRTVVYDDTIYWSLLWRDGPSEWLPFLVPDHDPHLPPGRPLRTSRASFGRRSCRFVTRPRCADHPGVRARHELRLQDERPDPHGCCYLLACDRALPRGLLVVLARGDEGGGRAAPGDPRGRGAESPALAPRVARHQGRDRLRVPRRRCPLRGRRASTSWLVGRGARPDSRALSAGRGDPLGSRLRRANRAGRGRTGPPSGCEGPTCSQHDRVARAEGRVRAGPRCPALRPASTDSDGMGLDGEARVRCGRERC